MRNNNTSSVNKTFTENDEILETERGNSNLSSNSKQKRESQTEPLSRKKKIVLTGDSMVNGISEKGLGVNHHRINKGPYSEFFWSVFSRIGTEYGGYGVSLGIQSECGKIWTRITPDADTFHAVHKVKIVNFPGGISEKILEKSDDIIKKKPEDLIVHVGTDDITNNVNLLTNLKKIFNKTSEKASSTSVAFSSISNCKDKTNTQKTLTDTNACLKFFWPFKSPFKRN